MRTTPPACGSISTDPNPASFGNEPLAERPGALVLRATRDVNRDGAEPEPPKADRAETSLSIHVGEALGRRERTHRRRQVPIGHRVAADDAANDRDNVLE